MFYSSSGSPQELNLNSTTKVYKSIYFPRPVFVLGLFLFEEEEEEVVEEEEEDDDEEGEEEREEEEEEGLPSCGSDPPNLNSRSDLTKHAQHEGILK